MHLLETEELHVFARVVAKRSLAGAAAELGMPRATVSRRLAMLEEKIGVRLLRRTTRSMTLTEAGRELLRHAEVVVNAALDAARSVQTTSKEIRGDVRLSVGPHVATVLAGVFADFLAAHPAVRLFVHVSNQRVDLQRAKINVAIRASSKLAPGLVARRLARASLGAFATPTYLKLHGVPRTTADLRSHRCLMGLDEALDPIRTWPAPRRRVAANGVVHSDDPSFLLELCRRGAGIGLLPTRLVVDAVSRGELVAVLADEMNVEGGIAIVYVDRKLIAPPVRAFIDWVVARAPSALG